MKRASHLVSLILAVLLWGPPAHAQSCFEDVGSFRSQVEVLVSDFYRAAEASRSLEPAKAEMLHQSVAEFEQAFRDATPEQLAALCDVFSRLPDLAQAPGLLATAAAAVVPSRGTSCLILSREQFLGIFVTAQVLRGVAAVLQTACGATQCITLACRITCALAGVGNGAVLIFDALLEENDYCGKSFHFELVREFAEETGDRLTALGESLESEVVPPLDGNLSSRASQSSVNLLQVALGDGLAALDARLVSAATDLASQGADRGSFQQASLRQRIEDHLQEGQVGRISRFQLPASVGGLLEKVRELVARTLLDNVAAGNDVGDAFDLFAEGDAALNIQAYKKAFGLYRQAYRAATGAGVFGGRSAR